MLEWFHWNFEDPANETPYESREGGYQYIWGGPFDALEQLGDRFGGLVPDEAIEAAAQETFGDGWQWAPNGRRVLPEEELSGRTRPQSTPASASEFFEDNVSVQLRELEGVLARSHDVPPPIGHNQPPRELDHSPLDAAALQRLQDAVRETLAEGRSGAPDVSLLETRAYYFNRVAKQVLGWLAKKADVALDEVAKSFGNYMGKFLAAGLTVTVLDFHLELSSKLSSAAESILKWIQLLLS